MTMPVNGKDTLVRFTYTYSRHGDHVKSVTLDKIQIGAEIWDLKKVVVQTTTKNKWSFLSLSSTREHTITRLADNTIRVDVAKGQYIFRKSNPAIKEAPSQPEENQEITVTTPEPINAAILTTLQRLVSLL
jgi:hypothetical protein